MHVLANLGSWGGEDLNGLTEWATQGHIGLRLPWTASDHTTRPDRPVPSHLIPAGMTHVACRTFNPDGAANPGVTGGFPA